MLKQDILEKSCEEIGKKLSSVIAMLSLIQIFYSFINTKINQHWFSENQCSNDLEITDPCTALGCKWQRSKNGKVLLSYVFSDTVSESSHLKPPTASEEKDIIYKA